MATQRIAAIDVGTNTVRAMVADRGESLKILAEHGGVTALGEARLTTGRLTDAARARTLEAIRDCLVRARDLHAETIFAFATAAVREADNGDDFVAEVKAELELELHVLPGEIEAELTFLGASFGLPHAEQVLVIDLGGGSTEFVLGRQGVIQQSQSAALGSRRQTLAAQVTHPVESHVRKTVWSAVRSALPEWLREVTDEVTIIGVGGTMTQLAALAQGLVAFDKALVHGYVLRGEVVAILEMQLGDATVADLYRWPGIEPGRAEVIFAGTAIVTELLRALQRDQLVVSTHGILTGAVLSV